MRKTSSSSSAHTASSAPLGLAVAGLHGFARAVTDLALAEPSCRLVAAGDPVAGLPMSQERVATLKAAGAWVVSSFEEALQARGVDAVWLPVPISLHRPFAEAAFAAGKAVLCEKPLAGSVEDALAMIAAADATGLPAAVGFHDLFDPGVLAFKRGLHGPGGIGELESITVLASWPRDDAYFRRNAWAGRLRHADRWVRDNPANNALAHYLMLGLFLAGDADLIAASPTAANARTFRAAAIETYDTVSARLTLGPGCVRPGASLTVHFTHAAAVLFQPQVLVRGRRGTWLWKLRGEDEDLARADHVACSPGQSLVREGLLPRFVSLCRGVEQPDWPYATFAAGLAHAQAVELIGEVAEPQEVSAALRTTRLTAAGQQEVVTGLLEGMKQAVRLDDLLELTP